MDEDLPVVLTLRTQCVGGSDRNCKLSSQMGSESLRTTAQPSWIKGAIMFQNDIFCMSQILVHEAINKFPSPFDSAFHMCTAQCN